MNTFACNPYLATIGLIAFSRKVSSARCYLLVYVPPARITSGVFCAMFLWHGRNRCPKYCRLWKNWEKWCRQPLIETELTMKCWNGSCWIARWTGRKHRRSLLLCWSGEKGLGRLPYYRICDSMNIIIIMRLKMPVWLSVGCCCLFLPSVLFLARLIILCLQPSISVPKFLFVCMIQVGLFENNGYCKGSSNWKSLSAYSFWCLG